MSFLCFDLHVFQKKFNKWDLCQNIIYLWPLTTSYPYLRILKSVVFVDVNECVAQLDDCGTNSRCANTHGSYNCTCKQGYQGNGRTCTGNYRLIILACEQLYKSLYPTDYSGPLSSPIIRV